MKIKAISLWEPWASLIRTGAKTIETRSWATLYRGPLLICAAKRGLHKKDLEELLCDLNFQTGLAPLKGCKLIFDIPGNYGITSKHLNFGKAVAIVNLCRIRSTGMMDAEDIGTGMPFGDFSPNRYAWQLEMVDNSFEPFPVKGHQGFFEVELDGKLGNSSNANS